MIVQLLGWPTQCLALSLWGIWRKARRQLRMSRRSFQLARNTTQGDSFAFEFFDLRLGLDREDRFLLFYELHSFPILIFSWILPVLIIILCSSSLWICSTRQMCFLRIIGLDWLGGVAICSLQKKMLTGVLRIDDLTIGTKLSLTLHYILNSIISDKLMTKAMLEGYTRAKDWNKFAVIKPSGVLDDLIYD